MNARTSTRLRLENITVKFPGVTAVDNVSLEVNPGEFFSLLGPSGCGKTTLLRTIAGFYRQDSGHIYFNDECIDRIPPHKRGTGMVFQNYAIFPHLTVWDNVGYGLRARKVSREEAARRIQAALELVDLVGLEKRKPKQLSGGQQQRVAVARAVVIEPHILLMDEPLANLDAKLRIRLRTELRKLQQQLGLTTIYVTHDQEEALSLSDRIAVMFRGRIAQLGTPEEIYQDPATREVFEFVGEGNYLDGEVTEIDGDSVVVTLSTGDGVRAELGGRSGAGRPLSKGTQVVVSFRPHEVEVVPQGAHGDPPGENTLRGTVQHLDYLGAIVRYHVDIGKGMTLLAEHYTAQGVPARQGDQLTVRIPPARVKLFDTDGMRIRGRGS